MITTPPTEPAYATISMYRIWLMLVCAIQRMIEKNTISNYEVFNVGTGIGYSVLDIVHTFEKVNNLKVNYQIKGRREGDIAKIWADTRKAMNY